VSGGRTTNVAGVPVRLNGPELEPGDPAPNFKLLVVGRDGNLAEISLKTFQGKRLLLLTVPSPFTPVCHEEGKRFNEIALGLPVAMVYVSTDTPWALKHWREENGVDRLTCASDFRYMNMEDYGVRITEGDFDDCLSRAAFFIGPDGTLERVWYVADTNDHPPYDEITAALKAAPK